jgi:hypothetical protein
MGEKTSKAEMRRTYKTETEIDYERGVIYVHLANEKDVEKQNLVTLIRICSLPKPIRFGELIDINYARR